MRKLSHALHVCRVGLPESLAPGVEREVADAVLLGDLRNRRLVRLAGRLPVCNGFCFRLDEKASLQSYVRPSIAGSIETCWP
jgi:hypothetical protein